MAYALITTAGLVDRENPYYEYVIKEAIKGPKEAEYLLRDMSKGHPYYNLVKEAVENNKKNKIEEK